MEQFHGQHRVMGNILGSAEMLVIGAMFVSGDAVLEAMFRLILNSTVQKVVLGSRNIFGKHFVTGSPVASGHHAESPMWLTCLKIFDLPHRTTKFEVLRLSKL